MVNRWLVRIRGRSGWRSALLLATAVGGCGDGATDVEEVVRPPFNGTIFIDPDIITADDPTAFLSIEAAGMGVREMFDRRTNAFGDYDVHLFDASFDDGLAIEVQVNAEFDSVAAAELAERYADAIGRIPTALRVRVLTMWVHAGFENFGGGNDNVLIHTGLAESYDLDGILEETLVHEGAHASLDPTHARSQGWIAAQQADGNYISRYARDNSSREDIAETMVPYLAVRYRRDRITETMANRILDAIPARIEYLDALGLDVHPIR